MELNYDYNISLKQLGKDKHSKVYSIKEYNTGKELIVKIFEDSRYYNYEHEKAVLTLLKETNDEEKNIFIMFKDMEYNANMFKIPDEVIRDDLNYLFYDYLSKLTLLDYISHNIQQIKEINVKFLCYKLLKGIEKLHSLNISHNKINLSNIMLDDNFNPKLIHFSEAYRNNDKINHNKDFFDICKILAKILSKGKFDSINYNEKNKQYIIYGITSNKKIMMEESKFWKNLKFCYGIEISEGFLNFFHIIIRATNLKKLINIKELIEDKWLSEVSKNFENAEYNFQKDFKELYETIIENNEKYNFIEIDFKNFIDINKKENNELKYPDIKEEEKRREDEKIINEIKKSKNNHVNNKKVYHKKFEDDLIIKRSIEKEIRANEKLIGRKQEKEENEVKLRTEEEGKIIIAEEKSKINSNIIEKEIETNKNINPEEMENKIDLNFKEIEIEKQTLNLNKEKNNFYKPKKCNINYLKVIFKNIEIKFKSNAIRIVMKRLKEKIKEKYDKTKIKIYLEDIADNEFMIYYVIPPISLDIDDIDEIKFLDEEFLKRVELSKIFEIKIELLEGIENFNSNNNNHQYYLIFNEFSCNKEEFYEQLKLLKKIAIDSLSNI